ncbi:hypothetical protein NPIL_660781 [Nephila pilipes]|uniref:Uncharacterized protein n=1 Tax=Nephila pilipes TaxID=299642 RepID=A0A8X6NXB7_NEPPI|nr:hypothetical protein NPIL_660781 [Nephila pilipes]
MRFTNEITVKHFEFLRNEDLLRSMRKRKSWTPGSENSLQMCHVVRIWMNQNLFLQMPRKKIVMRQSLQKIFVQKGREKWLTANNIKAPPYIVF